MRKNLSSIAAIEVGKFLALAAIVASLHGVFFPEYPYWKVFVMMALCLETAEIIYVFLLRPLRGQSPIFRTRPSDTFESSPLGNGFTWSRLGQRYSSDELILLFGAIAVMLLASTLWALRM